MIASLRGRGHLLHEGLVTCPGGGQTVFPAPACLQLLLLKVVSVPRCHILGWCVPTATTIECAKYILGKEQGTSQGCEEAPCCQEKHSCVLPCPSCPHWEMQSDPPQTSWQETIALGHLGPARWTLIAQAIRLSN